MSAPATVTPVSICAPIVSTAFRSINTGWCAKRGWRASGGLTVKLAEVEAVRNISAETYAAIEQEEQEEKQAEMLRGGGE